MCIEFECEAFMVHAWSRGSAYMASICSWNTFFAMFLLILKVGVIKSFCTVKPSLVTCTFFTLSKPVR